jgi:hypothetical protein
MNQGDPSLHATRVYESGPLADPKRAVATVSSLMRRTLLLLAALLLLAPAAAQARAVPQGFFGVMADGVLMTRDDASFAREFALMKASGVETVRPVVYWADMQPERGGPLITSSLDRLIGEAAKNGIAVEPVVLRAPAWARVDAGNVSSPPKDPADFAAFLTALIGRYGPSGTFWADNPQVPKRPQRTWQIWNEPNLDRYWSSPKPFAKPFVALLKTAHDAIKAADPGATVVAPGFGNKSWEAMEQAYKAGMNHSMYDVAATHPFSYRVSNVLKIVRLVRGVMAKHGDAKVPLSISEITWASSKGTAATDISDFATTPSGQAQKLTQAYKALMAKRRAWHIKDVIWSTWLSSDGTDGSKNLFDWSGLRRLDAQNPSGDPVSKPALAAYKKLALAAEK